MLQDKLKSATKAHHDGLESLMFVHQIMNKTLTISQYKTLLATNYIVHAAIESKLHAQLDQGLQEQLDIQNREKVNALLLDLQEMNMDPAELDTIDFDFSPKDSGNAAALGAMYVLEGATLGGNVIQKKLRANPAFGGLNLHYYGVYSAMLMPKWISFVEILNSNVPEKEHEIAERSAITMFTKIADVSNAVKSQLQSIS